MIDEVLYFLKPWNGIRESVYIYGISNFQGKGLRQCEGETLMKSAYADGYAFEVDRLCYNFALDQVMKFSNEINAKINVLEIGGGHGCFYDSVSNKIDKYFNIEPSELVCDYEFLKRLSDKRYFHIKASAEEMPVHDNTLDLVVSLASLDHIPNVEVALFEIARVLKPGGKFIFTLNNKRSWWKILLKNSELLRQRETLILRDHYILWGPHEAETAIGKFLVKSSLRTTCFFPQVPIIWKFLLPPLEKIGYLTKSLTGSNLLGVYQKSWSTG